MYRPANDRIQAYNSLASYYLHMAEIEPKESEQQRLISNSKEMIQAADNINSREPNTFMTKSFSYLVQGFLTSI